MQKLAVEIDLLQLADRYEQLGDKQKSGKRCFIGFDGTTDEILEVVDRRESPDLYEPLHTIADLGQRISDAAGKSTNLELVRKKQKIGGNGPICAVALLAANHEITFVGTLGSPGAIEPLFHTMSDRCRHVFTLGPSSTTWALEFADGKVMLGRLEAFRQITLDRLLQQIPERELTALHEEADIVISANWTMILETNQIWRFMADQIAPNLTTRSAARPRWMFVDLADPAKRDEKDIREALDLLRELGKKYSVVLGLNESEAARIARVCGLELQGDDPGHLVALAEGIRVKVGLTRVVIHAVRQAVSAQQGEGRHLMGPYCEHPALTTGAGDNFNAGYCNGLLFGLTQAEAIASGVATSGYYVRHAKSPTLKELAQFLRMWHHREL
jgi:ketohexokinase